MQIMSPHKGFDGALIHTRGPRWINNHCSRLHTEQDWLFYYMTGPWRGFASKGTILCGISVFNWRTRIFDDWWSVQISRGLRDQSIFFWKPSDTKHARINQWKCNKPVPELKTPSCHFFLRQDVQFPHLIFATGRLAGYRRIPRRSCDLLPAYCTIIHRHRFHRLGRQLLHFPRRCQILPTMTFGIMG